MEDSRIHVIFVIQVAISKIAESGSLVNLFDHFKIHKLKFGTAHSEVLTTHLIGINAR
jgi:hypothetical protein